MRNIAIETPQPARQAAERTWAERLKSLLFIGLCAAIGLAPLPLGSNRPVAWDILGLSVALLLAATLALPSSETRGSMGPLAVPAALFAAVALFVLVQASPDTPTAWHNPLWDQAADTLRHPVPGAISVDPHDAFIGLFRLLTYAGIFLLSYLLCRDRARAHRALKLVTAAGGAYTFYGFIIYFSGNATLLLWPKWNYNNSLTGTFVNRNSFATYLGLAALAALAQAFILFAETDLNGTAREKLVKSFEFVGAHKWLVALLVVVVIALLFTQSRGGLVATMAGLLALLLAMWFAPSIRRSRRLGIAALLVAVPGLVAGIVTGEFTNHQSTTARFFEMQSLAAAWQPINGDDLRPELRAGTERAIADHPLVGWGLESFPSVFPLYRAPDVPLGTVTYAHNSFLETILELGFPAAIALFAGILWLAGLAVRGLRRRRRDAIFPCLAVAATVLVAVNSVYDFSLQIPAVTATYFFLLGLGAAQSRSTRGRGAVSGD